MLNLAKVLCVLLAAKLTSAQLPRSIQSAKQLFDGEINFSLAEMKKSQAENAKCVKVARSMLELEIDDKIKLHSIQPEFFNDPDEVIMTAKNKMALIDEKGDSLDQIFETKRALLEDKQRSVDGYVRHDSDDTQRRRETALFINKIRETLPGIVKEATLLFSKKCGEAKAITVDALMELDPEDN